MIEEGGGVPALGTQSAAVGREVLLRLQTSPADPPAVSTMPHCNEQYGQCVRVSVAQGSRGSRVTSLRNGCYRSPHRSRLRSRITDCSHRRHGPRGSSSAGDETCRLHDGKRAGNAAYLGSRLVRADGDRHDARPGRAGRRVVIFGRDPARPPRDPPLRRERSEGHGGLEGPMPPGRRSAAGVRFARPARCPATDRQSCACSAPAWLVVLVDRRPGPSSGTDRRCGGWPLTSASCSPPQRPAEETGRVILVGGGPGVTRLLTVGRSRGAARGRCGLLRPAGADATTCPAGTRRRAHRRRQDPVPPPDQPGPDRGADDRAGAARSVGGPAEGRRPVRVRPRWRGAARLPAAGVAVRVVRACRVRSRCPPPPGSRSPIAASVTASRVISGHVPPSTEELRGAGRAARHDRDLDGDGEPGRRSWPGCVAAGLDDDRPPPWWSAGTPTPSAPP